MNSNLKVDFSELEAIETYAHDEGRNCDCDGFEVDTTIYSISITNIAIDFVPTPVIVLGANQTKTLANFGNPPFITINVLESSYLELLQETQFNPFLIEKVRIQITSPIFLAQQTSEIMRYNCRSANGVNFSYPIQFGNYVSAFQFQNNIMEWTPPESIYIDGQSFFTLNVWGLFTTVLVTLFLKKQLQPDDSLYGKPMIEESPDVSKGQK